MILIDDANYAQWLRGILLHSIAHINIDAPPEAIFAYLTEPQRLLMWQTLLSKAENVSGESVQAGTEFALVMEIGNQFPQAQKLLGKTRIKLMGKVTDYTRNKRLTITGESEFNDFAFTYKLETRAAGTTRLTQESQLDFKHPLLKAFEPLFQHFLQQRNEEDLAQLKRILEADAASDEVNEVDEE